MKVARSLVTRLNMLPGDPALIARQNPWEIEPGLRGLVVQNPCSAASEAPHAVESILAPKHRKAHLRRRRTRSPAPRIAGQRIARR